MAKSIASFRRRTSHCMVLMAIGCLFLVSGCGTVKSVTKATTGLLDGFGFGDKGVRQMIALIPFENRTPWRVDYLNETFMARLADNVRDDCSRIILVTQGDARFPPSLRDLPTRADGSVDNVALAMICRKAGLNGVVTGQLSHVSDEEEKQGVLFFREVHQVARIQFDMTMYHAGTAAKLLDDTFHIDIDMIEESRDGFGAGEAVTSEAMEESAAATAETVASTICDRLGEVPWEGRIADKKGNSVLILFGERAGLKADDVLEVYDAGKMVDGAGGYRYNVPGLKVGEVIILAVGPHKAEAAMTDGAEAIETGAIVRMKKD